MNDTIATISSRSGSKSMKDKNIKLLCGHPLSISEEPLIEGLSVLGESR